MSTLIQSISDVINSFIEPWISMIAQKYNIPKTELMTSWYMYNKSDMVVLQQSTNDAKSPTSRKSIPAYVNFCNKQRPLLKEQFPTMSFGDISKELGKRWKELSDDDKNSYSTKNEESLSSMPSISYSKDNLDHKTLVELRELCTTLNIKKTGNKESLIERILSQKCNETNTKIEDTPTNNNDQLTFYDNNKFNDDNDNEDLSSIDNDSFLLDDDDEDIILDDFDD